MTSPPPPPLKTRPNHARLRLAESLLIIVLALGLSALCILWFVRK